MSQLKYQAHELGSYIKHKTHDSDLIFMLIPWKLMGLKLWLSEFNTS